MKGMFTKITISIFIVAFLVTLLCFAISCTQPPVAVFDASKNVVAVGESIQFIDRSMGEIARWSWDFGDGMICNEQSPSHSYDQKGNYTASLTVSNGAGSDFTAITITVLERPVADFSVSETEFWIGKTVEFKDDSTGDIDSWLWDFGDGTTSTIPRPSHVYKNSGTYTVTLTVSNPASSNTKSKEDYIIVAGLTIRPIVFCSSMTEAGECTPRLSDSFQRGEQAWFYFEVIGFEQYKTDDRHEVWLTLQQLIFCDFKGNVLLALTDVRELHEFYTTLPDHVHFEYSLGQFESTDPLGVYTVVVLVEDKLSGETATRTRGLLLE